MAKVSLDVFLKFTCFLGRTDDQVTFLKVYNFFVMFFKNSEIHFIGFPELTVAWWHITSISIYFAGE